MSSFFLPYLEFQIQAISFAFEFPTDQSLYFYEDREFYRLTLYVVLQLLYLKKHQFCL